MALAEQALPPGAYYVHSCSARNRPKPVRKVLQCCRCHLTVHRRKCLTVQEIVPEVLHTCRISVRRAMGLGRGFDSCRLHHFQLTAQNGSTVGCCPYHREPLRLLAVVSGRGLHHGQDPLFDGGRHVRPSVRDCLEIRRDAGLAGLPRRIRQHALNTP